MTALIDLGIYVSMLSFILFIFRKKLVVSSFLKVFYLALIRTKIGLSSMNKLARRYPRLLMRNSYAAIILGFAGMAFISFDIIKGAYNILFSTAAPTVGLVLPFDVKGAFYVPFVYWLISIIVVIIVHEYSHGIIARLNNIRVKSSGLAFAGVVIPLIPGAFVDIDEKQLVKKSMFAQLSVFAAGPFANFVTATVFFVLLLTLIPTVEFFYRPTDIKITEVVSHSPAALIGLAVGDVILNIDDKKITTTEEFTAAFKNKKSGDTMSVNNKKTVLARNNNAPFLGVVVEQEYVQTKQTFIAPIIKWLKELVFWIFALNLGVGAFNLLPLGPLDGGRMFNTIACTLFKHKHAQKIQTSITTLLSIAIATSILHAFIA